MAKLHLKTTTKDLAEIIAEQTDLKITDVRHVLECLPFYIVDSVTNGKTVQIHNLGSFNRVDRKSRLGSDLNGKRIKWDKTYRMQFVPSRIVREKLREAANK